MVIFFDSKEMFDNHLYVTSVSMRKGTCSFDKTGLDTCLHKSNRKAMNRNWSNQKPNPVLKTKMGNK